MKKVVFITVLYTLLGLTKTMAQEAYAVYTSDNTTLTFYYDSQKSSRSGEKFAINTGNNKPEWNINRINERLSSVVFDPSFAGVRPTSTYMWFRSMYYLTSITGLEYLNTEKVTDMSYMFSECYRLLALDLTHFNTANVFKMNQMFYACENLATICVGDGWSTAKTSTYESADMFLGCHNLVGEDGTKYYDLATTCAEARVGGGYLHSASYATQTYNIWVSGIQVTYLNKTNICNDIFNSHASYDPKTNTLKLMNGNFTGKGTSSDAATGYGAGIYSQVNELTIEVEDYITVKGVSGCSGMLLMSNTTITGNYRLTASGDMGVHLGSTSSNLTVSGNVTLEADGTTGGITGYRRTRPFENYYSTLTVKDKATVNAKGLGTLADLVLKDSHAITSPTGAVWNADQNGVCDKDGKLITSKWVTIEYKEPPRADVNMDGTVDSADIVAVIKEMK